MYGRVNLSGSDGVRVLLESLGMNTARETGHLLSGPNPSSETALC